MKINFLLAAMMLQCASASAQIRLNQVGMSPNQEKTATIEGAVDVGSVKIVDASGKAVGVQPKFLRIAKSPWSGKERTLCFVYDSTTGVAGVDEGFHQGILSDSLGYGN